MKDYHSSSIVYESKNDYKVGFHLQSESEKEGCSNTTRDDRSIAGSSLYDKQRIDSMFDETRSLISGYSQNREIYGTKQRRASFDISNQAAKPKVTNSIQERIEKMFTEINLTECIGEGVKESSQKFPVAYLGSIPLSNKVTSLSALQQPLKQLYFSYKKTGKSSKPLQGLLEITKSGLKVIQHGNDEVNGAFEQLNPFPTIAVWAAVKFVCKNKLPSPGKEYAFMPLITDPKSVDKVSLFRALKSSEEALFVDEDNLPLFTVVMKQIGLSRQLECHGFICACAEDAIIIAANLYTSLVQAMPNTLPNGKPLESKDIPKCQNGISSVRRIGVCVEEPEIVFENKVNMPIKGKTAPTRPPRKVKSQNGSLSSGSLSDSNYRQVQETSKVINLSKELYKTTSSPRVNRVEKEHTKVERKYSISGDPERYRDNNPYQMYSSIQPASEHQDRGDILTKVAIPRSKSFLNAGGPFSSRYTTTLDGIGNGSKSSCRKSSIGSPLGLNELFQEFRHQEGLYNMDDILNAIIDSDGMSFNDLKPIYKEFVLKLALTLTKDELYQRSKSIMQKQKSKRQQIKRRNSSKLKRSLTTGGGIKKAFKKSVSSLKSSKQRTNSFEFTSVLFPSCGNKIMQKANTKLKCKKVFETSSASSIDLIKEKVKVSNFVSESQVRKNKSYMERNLDETSIHSKPGSQVNTIQDSSEKVCFLKDENHSKSEKGLTKDPCVNQTSSGYFSCSECSYDSETCTCTSAEKCYCSLGKKNKNTVSPVSNTNANLDASLSLCGCDTDSCLESEKCYCNQPDKLSIFEQLKQQGFAASESSVSRPESPVPEWKKKDTSVHTSSNFTSKENKSGLKSSKSLEFLQIQGPTEQPKCQCDSKKRSNEKVAAKIQVYEQLQKKQKPSVKERSNSTRLKENTQRRSYSSDNLALDYEMFNHNNNQNNINKNIKKSEEEEDKDRKVLVVSARDPWGKLIYVGASCRKSKKTRNGYTHSSFTVANEALSVKKSAEIAALFSQVKSEKEEVIYNTLEPPDYMKMKQLKGGYGDTNLENSLGYFP